ncbi:hypothetical protein GCM10011574_55880 [Microbispora bryophytorum]|uniref:Uncharacterized protein n=1 Tax=Microbispora bryophytorum TaxID=1460882 RepID=A0A8H9H791_9ACTN|nr:hypothetical protein GCM10011574_55880 [Microbispora bryophytorum]
MRAEVREADPDTGRLQDALRRISNRAATVLPIAALKSYVCLGRIEGLSVH